MTPEDRDWLAELIERVEALGATKQPYTPNFTLPEPPPEPEPPDDWRMLWSGIGCGVSCFCFCASVAQFVVNLSP